MTNKQVSLFLILVIVFILTFTSCGVMSKSPEDVYWEFWNACNSGDIATVESLLSDDAKNESKNFGPCFFFAHDAGGHFEPEEFKDNNPESKIVGNTAYLKWTFKDGDTTTTVLYKVNGDWKINTLVMDHPE